MFRPGYLMPKVLKLSPSFVGGRTDISSFAVVWPEGLSWFSFCIDLILVEIPFEMLIFKQPQCMEKIHSLQNLKNKFQDPDFYAWVDYYVEDERWFSLYINLHSLSFGQILFPIELCCVAILECSVSKMWWTAGTEVGDFETRMKTIGFCVRDKSLAYKKND